MNYGDYSYIEPYPQGYASQNRSEPSDAMKAEDREIASWSIPVTAEDIRIIPIAEVFEGG